MILWHNPRCNKSRQTLALLEGHGHAPDIRLYLTDPPTEAEITATLTALDRPAIDMMRPKDAAFKEAGLTRDDDPATLIAAMAKNPKLIERPILIHGARAAIGRPPEAVLDIL